MTGPTAGAAVAGPDEASLPAETLRGEDVAQRL